MADTAFVDWAINLLEQVETSQEKKEWCKKYSVYSNNPGQEELYRDMNTFFDRTYEEGLVITDYRDVIQKWNLEERDISTSESTWLETKNYMCVLACIAWHFRRDHFNEGSLISQSVAGGSLLRLFRKLKELSEH